MPETRVGSFVLLEPIATGGMGQVWRAQHTLGTQVAVKIITADGIKRSTWVNGIHTEIRAVAGLRHPHIVQIHDAGTTTAAEAATSGGLLPEGGPWFAMEYADGGTLHNQPITCWQQLKDVLSALLEALAHAHARGIIHCDLKPANVLFSRGQLKLTDFGMVTQTDPSHGDQRIGGGTPAYMAPEQFEGAPWDVGPWTDLYSLGCVAYALATGARVFKERDWMSASYAHRNKPIPTLTPRFEVPGELELWLHSLLEKDWHHRTQRAADAVYALRNLHVRHTLSPIDDNLWEEKTEIWAPRALPPMPSKPSHRPPNHLPVGLGLHGLRAMPFVGRRQERRLLWKLLRAVHKSQHTQAVILRGTAGVGKSRLAQWLCQTTHELGSAHILRTVHSPIPAPFDGIPGLLARAFRVNSTDLDTIKRAIAAELTPRDIRDQRIHHALATIIHPQAEGTLRKEQRHLLIARVLRELSADRPAILWLDDVHWDNDTIDLCTHLLSTRGGPSCLLVLTVGEESLISEPEAQAALTLLTSQPTCTEVHLEPLKQDAAVALFTNGLGLQPRLAHRLHRRTAGNPMFAVELVSAWVSQGLLVPGNNGLQLISSRAIDMPATIDAVWDGRLTRLIRSYPEFELPLSVGAALGMEVDLREWAEATRNCGVLPPAALWTHLQERRLITWHADTNRMVFVHGQLRENILERTKQSNTFETVHLAIAHALTEPSRRGLHLLHTPQYLQGAALLLDCAREASETNLHRTLRLLQYRDRALAARCPDHQSRAEGWLIAAKTCRYAWAIDRAKKWERTARHWAKRHKNLDLYARSLLCSAACCLQLNQLEKAEIFINEALRTTHTLRPELQADAHYELACLQAQRNDFFRAEKSLRVVCALDPTISGQRRAGTLLGQVLTNLNRPEEAIQELRRVLPLAEQSARLMPKSLIHNAIGEVLRSTGRLHEAEVEYTTSIQILQSGSGLSDPGMLINLGITKLLLGQHQAAHTLFTTVIESDTLSLPDLMRLAAHAGLTATTAASNDVEALHAHLRVLQDDTSGIAAQDFAICLQRAGEHAASREPALSRLAFTLAAKHYRASGHPHKANALLSGDGRSSGGTLLECVHKDVRLGKPD